MPEILPQDKPENDWQWLTGQLAESFIRREIEKIENLLPEKYYAVGLQLGIPIGASYLAQVNGNIRIHLDNDIIAFDICGNNNKDYSIYSDMHQLPLGRQAADLVILPHTLDLSPNPTLVLREISQVIDEDGTLVLTGFNPASLLGLSKFLSKKIKRKKVTPASYSARHVKDWLQLIGFEVFASCYMDYLPPVSHPRVRRALGFLDKAGDRWWPVFAGVYIILAKKKDWKPAKVSMLDSIKKRLNPKLPQPAARNRG